MTDKIEFQIINKIKKAKRGSLFFADSFSAYGRYDAIRKALERLVKGGDIDRVAQGIYVRPKIDPVIGKVTPAIDDIAMAIARRDHARTIPTGAFALNKLGLSTQVPMNIVYLTDGTARKIKIGNFTVSFKKTTPRNVAAVGEISSLVIQALRTMGKNNIQEKEVKKIQELLKKEKPTRLEHDIRLAPVWIKEIMNPVYYNE